MASNQPEMPSSTVDDGDKTITIASTDDSEPIVQYILVRTDLKWGPGALIAQACHACTAILANTWDHQSTKAYLADMANMHKVILKADKIDDLIGAETKLKEANIAHHLWVEKPENIVTCLAVSPQPKALVRTLFQNLKLFR